MVLIPLTLMEIEGQVNLNYQKPHDDILALVDAPLPPAFRINSAGTTGVMLYRKPYKSIEELSAVEMRLAGLRINPKSNIGSRVRYYYDAKILDINNNKETSISGMPEQGQLAYFLWSPDESRMAFTNTNGAQVELWVIDIAKARAMKLDTRPLNANMGRPFSWFKDSQSLLVKIIPSDKKELIDQSVSIPSGPTISENDGKMAQNRTYQDLLKNASDEQNFEELVKSELHRVYVSGHSTVWKSAAMYRSFSFSPDGELLLVSVIDRPFSYLVPYYRFPTNTSVYNKAGDLVKDVHTSPLLEDIPKGFMATSKGKRSISWRGDKPSTIYWVEALDGGDPANEVAMRDEIFEQDAPFNGASRSLIKIVNRYAGITWGNDDTAIAYDRWWNTRNTKTYAFNPSDNSQKPEVLFDRNYQDRYNDPGDFVMTRNKYNRFVLEIIDDKLYLLGDGYSDKGIFPFVDEYVIGQKESKRLYQASDPNTLERLFAAVDMKSGKILSRIESANDYPNYYFRNIYSRSVNAQQITHFENPFEGITEAHKEVINYKRDDGVDLSGTLYLPPGYDRKSGEKLPMILWAYPREFKDKSSASQVTSSPNEFTYPYYGSPLYWVMRGYAVLDDAAFPILGENDEQPNDSFREQLVSNAKAAIDAVDDLGYVDRNRVGVGGHSYGAFMVANLLSHSDLFAAGIARSGAYNRTLTPFGFQAEERSYWESPEVYYTMSPFMHADKMKTPLLLIHGEADNNSGTYPMQSQRYFNALKGLGATVRLVMLPKESHGYSARESILHMLWEQDNWLETHVKNRVQTEEQRALKKP